MAVKTYSKRKQGEVYISKHFRVKEFACKDGTDAILIEDGLLIYLEKVYTYFNCSRINISSAYRTPSYDKRVGGRGAGNHVQGKAVDFVCYDKNGKIIPSSRVVLYLEDIGVKGIGYRCGGSPNYTHMDINYRTNKWFGDEAISMSKGIWNIKSGCYSFYDYLNVFKPYNVKIITSMLNVRKGIGTAYAIVDKYKKGETAKIIEINKDKTWGKTDKGWICIKPSYVTKV